MTKKKAKKKTAAGAASTAKVEVEEKPGEEVKSEPAHVEEQTVLVRGTKGSGFEGTSKLMSKSKYEAWRKKA